jgi:hypothetical protein
MAIRVFINRWAEQQDGDTLYIKDPIDDYLNDISLSAPVESTNYYARISLNRRPDRVYLIKVMRGDLTQAEWDSLGALTGVRAVPAFRFDKLTSTVNTSTKNKIYQVLDALGIPRTTFDSSATFGGFLRNVLKELDETQESFGTIETLPEEWA